MASEAQVQANRLNAQKSTGPRTGAGKAAVAQNAVRHGLLAEQTVIKGEDPGEFEFYRDQMLGELSPAGAMESMLAERVVGLAWRLRRAERIQAQVFDTLLVDDATGPMRKLTRSTRPKGSDVDDSHLALGRVAIRDFVNYRTLDRLGLYERRIEHSLYRTMTELQKLRQLRELDEPAHVARGIVKAGGPGDGGTESEGNHRQAALDAATQGESTPEPPSRTDDAQLRQTKPIPPVLGQETGFEDQSKANQSQLPGPPQSPPAGRGFTARGNLVSCAPHGPSGPSIRGRLVTVSDALETEKQIPTVG